MLRSYEGNRRAYMTLVMCCLLCRLFSLWSQALCGSPFTFHSV